MIAQVNEAARLLMAGAAPGEPATGAVPEWLARAHRRALTAQEGGGPLGPACGPVGDRVFEAHPVHADGERVVWWLVDVTGRRQVTEGPRAGHDWNSVMVEAATELLSSLNLDRCLEMTVRLAVRHLADAALVVLPLGRRRYALTYGDGGDEVVREDLSVDPREVPGLAEALRGFPPVPARWSDLAGAPGWVARDGLGEAGRVVVVALPGHGLPSGALVLLRRSERAGFSPEEEEFAELFAARAGTAISVARLYAEQAAITETLMADLLPPVVPRLDGVALAARYRPAGDGERVGGDFYDVHPVAGTREEPLVVLGDVAGKGLEAAVLTGRIRNTLKALLPVADDHRRVLDLLNGVLLSGDRKRFVTLVLASIERRDPGLALRLTSAGHPPPVIVRNDGRVEAARTQGTLIGMLEPIDSVSDTVLLAPGESCLLYSDGITEAMGGPLGAEMFDEERLYAELAHCAGMPAEALAERVLMLASQWVGGGEHDDMAIVVISAPRSAPDADDPAGA
ncbi:PP2C family protein-serine/threonine phosphatase [Nonomuraea sp. NPDC050783]|uniref:PP2C family protein-serine/threonine phosphatase n=1 Tax=Nonomuraea sp. NPDC050783 TaxID=3154634 RepID=UPI0034650FD1